jgi:hypothetical protein
MKGLNMDIIKELETELVKAAGAEDMRKEWNKFARLCLRDEGYDSQTIAYVLHYYRNWDLSAEQSKLSYATSLLGYARHLWNY